MHVNLFLMTSLDRQSSICFPNSVVIGLLCNIFVKELAELNINVRIINNLIYGGDTVLLAENEQELQDLVDQVNWNGADCDWILILIKLKL